MRPSNVRIEVSWFTIRTLRFRTDSSMIPPIVVASMRHADSPATLIHLVAGPPTFVSYPLLRERRHHRVSIGPGANDGPDPRAEQDHQVLRLVAGPSLAVEAFDNVGHH